MASTEREAWLLEAVESLKPLFAEHGADVPTVRVTCGFPSQGARPGTKNHRLGECWAGQAAADGVPQIFITPTINSSARVVDILAHELVHAIVGCQVGHKGAFAKLAKAIGLTGKMTATVASPELETKCKAIVASIGEYPHSALGVNPFAKKQTTRLLKAECSTCGCIIRITAKWVEVADGDLSCPICSSMMVVG